MRTAMNTPRKLARAVGNHRGFTLVEVLVASMILIVALLTLASMFPVGYKQIADAGRMTVAVSGARHILEDVGDVPFANISNLNGVDTATNSGVIAGLSGTEAAMAEGNPALALERGEAAVLPPVLYLQGTADQMHPREHLDRFVAQYRQRGAPLDLAFYDGEVEGFINRKPGTPNADAALQRIIDFVHERLG